MKNFSNFYSGKKVLLTGHTGFKGSWMAEWLLMLGADLTGASLEAPTQPALFDQLALKKRMRHEVIDIRNTNAVSELIQSVQPDIVFHLAAQSLVRDSYNIPIETFDTNVMGTIHLMDGLRQLDKPCTAVMITTDKSYENREWLHSYREEDAMGGYDPYSSSKGCAELAIAAYRRSFFNPEKGNRIALASARAGNVLGGGDWAKDRIVPDCIRAISKGETIPVRNKIATRPWQHVLEPLGGYLLLAQKLSAYNGVALGEEQELGRSLPDFASGFNFGPNLTSNRTVAELVEELTKTWAGDWEDCSDPNAVHEASKLNLAFDKAFHLLQWQPKWDFEKTISEVTGWYREVHQGADPLGKTREQILQYTSS
ncbi:CDP-glucose 4,6-dehydratase [Akkermansiaceae bacterium]|nr:CDP-glucose 4,6-dehydratase [Akkermansiaceae bacterium]